MRKFIFLIPFLIVVGSVGCGRFSVKRGFHQAKSMVDRFFGTDKVNYQRLSWKKGDYFPSYIYSYFPSAKQFVAKFPDKKTASSSVRLIEVKKLDPFPKTYHESNLSWSENGSFLSYEILTKAHRKIMVKNLVGGYIREIFVTQRGDSKEDVFSELFEPATSYNSYLSWSSDERYFAFMSNGGTGNYNIYVGGVNKKDRKITNHAAKDGYADWNKESNEIVFVSGRTGKGDLYLTDPDGAGKKRITFSDQNDLFPKWSPDGEVIVYASGTSTNHDIFVLAKNGGFIKPIRIVSLQSDELRPTFSPNGKYISFYSNAGSQPWSSRWNILVLDISNIIWREEMPSQLDLEPKLVAENVVLDLNSGPAWTPDSKKIIYVQKSSKEFNPIYLTNIFTLKRYHLATNTKMNHDVMCSNSGIISFRAQVNSWDKVFLALTNQSIMLQK